MNRCEPCQVGNQAALNDFFQVNNSGLLIIKENIMQKIKQYFLFFSLLVLSQYTFAAGEAKRWQELQLVIVELNGELKPIDKKEITLEKAFNATNEIFKIDFNNLLDEKSLERKLNIQADTASILQRFTTPEQATNWATQIKLNNGKTYYFLINKVELKK